MLEFIITNYMVFIIAGIVLLLGLFGYMMDKKKYKQYRQEIANEQKAIDSLESTPDIDSVATPVMLDEAVSNVQQTGEEANVETLEPANMGDTNSGN